MDATAWQQVLDQNELERTHLQQVVDELTDEELSRPLQGGWTVAAVLAHLAFWDIRAYTVITKWRRSGIEASPIDTDVVNDVTRELCLAVPPRVAAKLSLKWAQAIDSLLEEISPEFVETIRRSGTTMRLERHVHRREHLDEIQSTLARFDAQGPGR